MANQEFGGDGRGHIAFSKDEVIDVLHTGLKMEGNQEWYMGR